MIHLREDGTEDCCNHNGCGHQCEFRDGSFHVRLPWC